VSSGTNNIYIGNAGISTNSNTIRIGTSAAFTDSVGISHPKHTATFIAGIRGGNNSKMRPYPY